MLKNIAGWFKIDEDELAIFIWTALILFLVRSSGITLNNYAETVFLKRFCIEYLPYVSMGNAVVTFVLMGYITGMVARLSGIKRLGWQFLFCGVTVVFCRLLIPLGSSFVSPIFLSLRRSMRCCCRCFSEI
jgi:hypothetical protein